MTRFDLHPEELLERAQRGTASAAELDRLKAHLAECSVCRIERALSAQVALDVTPRRDERLVVARLKRNVAAQLTAPGRRVRRRGSRALVVLGLAALGTASAAAAATLILTQADVFHQGAEPLGIATSRSSVPAPPAATRRGPLEKATPAAEEKTEPEAAPAEALPAEAEVGTKTPALEAATSAELFGRANQARRAGQVKEAVRLYRSLQERFAGSSEELVSRVALGRLLLDRLGDSRGALVQFNSYLASPGQGALREEALVGRALSLGRIGRAHEERAAWAALLEASPKSAHARRAQARLAELEAKPAAKAP